MIYTLTWGRADSLTSMRLIGGFLIVVFVAHLVSAAQGKSEPVYTATDLYTRCTGSATDQQLCFAYIRGFSDGNRWVLRDLATEGTIRQSDAVCVPNAEAINVAADLFVARFRNRQAELTKLSPFRALSIAL